MRKVEQPWWLTPGCLFAEKESRNVSFQAFQDLEFYYKSRFTFEDI